MVQHEAQISNLQQYIHGHSKHSTKREAFVISSECTKIVDRIMEKDKTGSFRTNFLCNIKLFSYQPYRRVRIQVFH